MPEFWSSTIAGLQVPVILLLELLVKAGTAPPVQIFKLVPKLKVGVILAVTVTLKSVLKAHCPAVGVKV